MKKENIFISIIGEAGKEELITAEFTTNSEVASFSLPHILEAPDLSEKVGSVKGRLNKPGMRVGMHGPVMDLYYDSRDPKIKQVARQRILQGLDIAGELGAEFMVAHSTFNSLAASEKYPANWRQKAADFWKEIMPVAERKKVRIVFENIWDKRPEMIREVIDDVQSDYFKACFDTGHYNIFSEVNIDEWIAVWGDTLSHLHLHNNFGEFDEHNGFANGTFDFEPFFAAMKKYNVDPTMTIEVRRREDLEPSAQKMETLLNKYGS